MALQYETTLRNSQLDDIETAAGGTAHLRIYDNSGGVPANCAAAAVGSLLATLTLPADYFNAAASGQKTKLGTWTGTASAGAGATPGYWRLMNTGETTTYMQGTSGVGSGDLSFDGTITSGQTITVNTFTITAGGA